MIKIVRLLLWLSTGENLNYLVINFPQQMLDLTMILLLLKIFGQVQKVNQMELILLLNRFLLMVLRFIYLVLELQGQILLLKLNGTSIQVEPQSQLLVLQLLLLFALIKKRKMMDLNMISKQMVQKKICDYLKFSFKLFC